MDEKQREQRVDYVEEADALEADRTEEQVREARERYPDEMQDVERVPRNEEVRDRSPAAPDQELVTLLDERQAQEFRSRWQDIQTNFVDNPKNSVEQADELVNRVINSITENFASERSALEDQWNQGQQASTEDLRLAIKRYRSFFNRLLTLEAAGTGE